MSTLTRALAGPHHPRLVVLSITGFGPDRREGGRAECDQLAQGEAGLMPLTGSSPDDPQKGSVPIADQLDGMYGAYGILAGPPLRFFDADGNGTARSAHPAPPTFDEDEARIRVAAGARDPMRGES